MDLQDFLNETQPPRKVVVEYQDKRLKFYVKEESAFDQIEMLQGNSDMISKLAKNINPGTKKEDIKQQIDSFSGNDAAAMQTYRARSVYQLVCNKNGDRLWASFDEMLKALPSKLINKIAGEIEKTDSVEEAEKN